MKANHCLQRIGTRWKKLPRSRISMEARRMIKIGNGSVKKKA
jgi:hypothetical protein